MKISIASDHAGFEQKQALVGYLASKGHDVIDRGPDCDDRVDYPDYAARVAHDVVDGMAERGSFIIDPDGRIQAYEVIAGGVGRNADELLRRVQALQFVREHGDQVCPAKWQPGEQTLKPSLDLVGIL